MKRYILISSIFLLLSGFSVSAQTDKLLVLVNSQIYSALKFEIDRYIDDIGTGYTVELCETLGGTPQDLRNYIISQSNNLAGCIFIGRMPNFFFEIEYDAIAFHYTSFPCDLYFMDLDGSWSDEDSDGLYDSHTTGTGDVAPEIFLGRIDASHSSAYGENQVDVLRRFFNRDHNYWSGAYTFRKTGLLYTDDDWKNYWNVNVGMPELYGQNNFQLINDERVNADDYINNRLGNDQYEFIQVGVHSDANTHYFNVDGAYPRTVSSEEIRNISLKALGYNLFACSACDYTQDNFLGGAYIFNNSEKSLVAIGSSKIGSMFEFYAFYKPLGENKPIGQAFKEWFDFIAPYDDYNKAWHYGMTIIGDPMIKFNCGDSNHGPLADIGKNRRVLWPDASIQINAVVRDDGLPAGSQVTQRWEKINGPGDVLFENMDSSSTSMNFTAKGDYRIKLTATDGEYISEDFADIKVCRIKWAGETDFLLAQQNGIIIQDSLAFLTTSAGLQVINVADKTNPFIVSSYPFEEPPVDPYLTNLDADSGFAYVVLSEKGMEIIDITESHNPYKAGSFKTYDPEEKANDVKVIGDYAYVADNVRGLMVIDIHDRSNPELIGFCPTEGTAERISIQGNYGYIADGYNGLRIIDLSDKTNPVEVGYYNDSVPDCTTKDIQIMGNYAYICTRNYNDYKENCIRIIDISNKTNPFEVYHYDGYFKGLYVKGNYLYYYSIDPSCNFGILDISSKTNPKFIESYISGEAYLQDIMNIYKSGQYVYLPDNFGYQGLNIFQVSLDNTRPDVYAGDDRRTYRSKISLQGLESDDNLPGGSSLSWSWQKISGPGDVSFVNPDKANAEVHFSDSGTYVLRLSVTDGELSGYDDIRINNFSGPPKSSNVEVCEGDIIPGLIASGDTIQWYSDSQLTDLLHTGDTLVTRETTPGVYTYYVTQIIEGIESDYNRVELSINPLPVIFLGEDTTITRDQFVILGPYSDRNTYLWSDGSVKPYLEISGNEIGPGNHTISVLVADTNTCIYSDSLTVQVVFPTNTGNTGPGNDLMVFPNPADKLLNIKISDFHSENILVKLYNQQGELLKYTKTCTDNAGNIIPVNISDLPPGIYYLKIIAPTKQFIGKVVIQ